MVRRCDAPRRPDQSGLHRQRQRQLQRRRDRARLSERRLGEHTSHGQPAAGRSDYQRHARLLHRRQHDAEFGLRERQSVVRRQRPDFRRYQPDVHRHRSRQLYRNVH